MMRYVISADLSSTLDGLAAAAQHDGRAPSLVLAAGRSGDLQHLSTHGSNPSPTGATQYRVGSITKTFTATLILQLRDQGQLDLDDTVDRWLPELSGRAPTIRRLLTHTAGLQSDPEGSWWERSPGGSLEQLLAGITDAKFSLPPGRFRHYSNLGFGLLGAVVERIVGAPWRDVLAERILQPLGLRDTGCRPREPYARGYLVHPWLDVMREEPTPDTGAMAPAGQLWSTVGDLLRWGSVLAQGHAGVLAPETALEMRTVTAIADPEEWTRGTGLGVQLDRVDDRLYCGHTGSMPGFVACLAVHPPTGWSTTAFANCYTGAQVTTLAHAALDVLLDAASEPVPAWTPTEPAPDDIAPLTGRWWWMGNEITIGYRDGRLLGTQDGEVAELERVGPDVWRYLNGSERGELLRVLRDPDGNVEALDIHTFIFTRDVWPKEPR